MADDHPLFRKAVRDTLEMEPDFTVIGEVNDGEEAVKQAVQLRPDVVIMDISMPLLNGLDATRQIKSLCADTNILVLTIHNDIEHVLSILEAGASGYLTKSATEEEVVAAVRSVNAGEMVTATRVFKDILHHALRYSTKPLILENNPKFTPRELEVFKLMAKGLSNKAISSVLYLSLSSVKGYTVEIFSKLKVNSRTEAVIFGLRMGLINFNDIEENNEYC